VWEDTLQQPSRAECQSGDDEAGLNYVAGLAVRDGQQLAVRGPPFHGASTRDHGDGTKHHINDAFGVLKSSAVSESNRAFTVRPSCRATTPPT